MAYFISSDFHAFHTNICKGVSSWNNKDSKITVMPLSTENTQEWRAGTVP